MRTVVSHFSDTKSRMSCFDTFEEIVVLWPPADRAGGAPSHSTVRRGMYAPTRQRLRLATGTELSFLAAGDASRQPPSLMLWGRHDVFFELAETLSWMQALPRMEAHVFDAGHLLLETHTASAAPLIRDFIKRTQQDNFRARG